MCALSKKDIEKAVEHFRSQPSLPESELKEKFCDVKTCVYGSIKKKNGEWSKKDPHQYRIKVTILDVYVSVIEKSWHKISVAPDFDELLSICTSLKVKGIGALCIYDTAYRIGRFLLESPVLPNKVFLHAGVIDGAELFLNRSLKGVKYITLAEIIEINSIFATFTCHELEAFFCLYHSKDRIDKIEA